MSGFLPDDIEKSADHLDQATALTELTTQRAIDEVTARVAPETHPDFEAPYCLNCGETIPETRLAMGRIRCVTCQTRKETLLKQQR